MSNHTSREATAAAFATVRETPLERARMGVLVVSATLVILLFYLLCLCSLLFVAALLVVDFGVALALMRIGLSRVMGVPIGNLLRLAGLIFQSLNIREGPEYNVAVAANEAPPLWAAVAEVARQIGVRQPDEMVFEMRPNAWVRLRGYGRGQGHCVLGLGFDLLVLFSAAELRSVLAHEMAHAKLVQRGYKGWLTRGIVRVSRMALILDAEASTRRSVSRMFLTASCVSKFSGLLGRSGSRLVATYSRQDEFAADRVAAAICGTEVYREALIKIHAIDATGVVPDWRERRAQSQLNGSFCDWLRDRLTPEAAEFDIAKIEALEKARRDPYDTHPILADRLAALPTAGLPVPEAATELDRPALELLPDADGLAMRVVAGLQAITDREERKETDRLRKVARKEHRGQSHLRPLQWVAIFIIMGGALGAVMFGIVFLGDTSAGYAVSFLASLGAVYGGVVLYRRGAYREISRLAAPPMGLWRDTAAQDPRGTVWDPWRYDLEAELRGQLPTQLTGDAEIAAYWGDRAYAALGECNYREALLTAQFCLSRRPKDPRGLLAKGIAAAYFERLDWVNEAFGWAIREAGLSASLTWALGWALALTGDWRGAEGYLLQTISHYDRDATPHTVLALAQWHQSKFSEAAASVRRAVALAPDEAANRVVLLRILVDAGLPGEAGPELDILRQGTLARDLDVQIAAARIAFLRGDTNAATASLDELEMDHPGPLSKIRAGNVYREAHLYDRAAASFAAASEAVFLPEALLGLAGCAHHARELEAAKRHLLAALDLTRECLPGTPKPLQLLPLLVELLKDLEEPIDHASAWVFHFPLEGTPGYRAFADAAGHSLSRFSMTVCAANRAQAEACARSVCQAFQPELPLPPNVLSCEEAPRAQRPVDAVRPGIHAFSAE